MGQVECPVSRVTHDPTFWVLALAGFCIWLLLAYPVLFTLNRAYRQRFANIEQGLSSEALGLYLKLWFPNFDRGDVRAAFRKRHLERFWGRNWATVAVFVTLVALVNTALGYMSCAWLRSKASGVNWTLASALAGGLAWVTYDQIVRLRRCDYTASDVAAHALRLVLAAPMGLALTALVKEDAGPAFAFLLGAFPTTTLFRYSQRIVDRRLQLGDSPAATEAFDLEALQGIGRFEAERFSDVGMRSILRLAYCDPVELALRTNFDFDYLADCVSQALLWTYVTGKLRDVQALGLRGAVEASNLWGELASDDQSKQAIAEENLREIAEVLKVSTATARRILDEVTSDPYASFNCSVWSLKAP